MSNEQWRPIPGYSNYRVSSLGRVLSLQPRWNKPKLLNPSVTTKGYLRVQLYVSGKATGEVVHKLVLITFKGLRPKPHYHASHLNGDKTDNRISNLKWVTPKENEAHKLEHGRRASCEKHGRAKLRNKDVSYIRRTHKRTSYHDSNTSELSKKFGVSKTTIRSIVRAVTWAKEAFAQDEK